MQSSQELKLIRINKFRNNLHPHQVRRYVPTYVSTSYENHAAHYDTKLAIFRK
jgi:hypothetical protein